MVIIEEGEKYMLTKLLANGYEFRINPSLNHLLWPCQRLSNPIRLMLFSIFDDEFKQPIFLAFQHVTKRIC
ncbi:Uncharacterised protein [Legionella taurinensis]|nr:Uncharacterised protein [Legionella taurinensis]